MYFLSSVIGGAVGALVVIGLLVVVVQLVGALHDWRIRGRAG